MLNYEKDDCFSHSLHIYDIFVQLYLCKRNLYIYFLVIEVAIGEYGTDVISKILDTTKLMNINGHKKCHTISYTDHETQLENGAYCLYNIYCNTYNIILLQYVR